MAARKTILLLTVALMATTAFQFANAAPVDSSSVSTDRTLGLTKRWDDCDDDDCCSDDDDDCDSDDDEDCCDDDCRRLRVIRVPRPFSVPQPFPVPAPVPFPASVPAPVAFDAPLPLGGGPGFGGPGFGGPGFGGPGGPGFGGPGAFSGPF